MFWNIIFLAFLIFFTYIVIDSIVQHRRVHRRMKDLMKASDELEEAISEVIVDLKEKPKKADKKKK